MEFVVEIPVRFGDTDPARIVYVPNFVHYAHVAFEGFMGQTSRSYAEWIGTDGVGFPVRTIECDFARPFAYGETVYAFISVERVGNSSIDLLYRFRADDDPEAPVRTTVRERRVCARLDPVEVLRVPEEVRQLASEYRGPS